MDPALAPDPDPTPDPTLLFSLILRIQKKFSYFFLITCPQAHHLQSEKFNFLLEFCVKILFCRHYLSQLNTFVRKGKDLEPDPGLNLWLVEPDPDPGVPKTCGSGSGSGSPTLVTIMFNSDVDWRLWICSLSWLSRNRLSSMPGCPQFRPRYFSEIFGLKSVLSEELCKDRNSGAIKKQGALIPGLPTLKKNIWMCYDVR